jgi:hypothetical protein
VSDTLRPPRTKLSRVVSGNDGGIELAQSIQFKLLGRSDLQIPVLTNSCVEAHHLVGRQIMAVVSSLVTKH